MKLYSLIYLKYQFRSRNDFIYFIKMLTIYLNIINVEEIIK